MLYTLGGSLARLAASDDRDRFVLRGGMLLAAFGARRPTRDLDGGDLQPAIAVVAHHCQARVRPLADVLSLPDGTSRAFPNSSLVQDPDW